VMLCVPLAAVVVLLQIIPLDAGAHGSVDVHDAARKERLQLLERIAFLQRILPRLRWRYTALSGCKTPTQIVSSFPVRKTHDQHPGTFTAELIDARLHVPV
jgi:hypothetical protein